MGFFNDRVDAVKEAYRANRYQKIEDKFQQRIDGASLPLFGGLEAWAQGIGTDIKLGFSMAWAGLTGSHADVKDVKPVEIPTDIADTSLAEDYQKVRTAERKGADLHANSWEALFQGEVKKSFRLAEAGRHESAKADYVHLPGDAAGEGAPGIVRAGAAATVAAADMITHMPSSNPLEVFTNLTAPLTPIVTAATEAIGSALSAKA